MVSKILYITPCGPSLSNGGGRHCYSNLRTLASLPGIKVDYIGPKFDYNLPGIQRDHFDIVLMRDYTFNDKIAAFLKFASTSLVGLFKKDFVRNYPISEYKLVFVETTRCGFVFEKFDKKTIKICNVHNVEYDYLAFNGKGSTRLARINVHKSEKKTLNSCDIILVMHDADKRRLEEIYEYKMNNTKFIQHPVCSFLPKEQIVPMKEREKVIFFGGSLDSYFNEIGLKEFINKCWPSLENCGYKFRVAGRNPSSKLVSLLMKKQNIEIIPNPKDMGLLMRDARLLILPDLYGTGMKLRVAEALSLGVPVIGTKKGLRGYQNISQFGLEVENISDMTRAISTFIDNEDMMSKMSINAYNVWKTNYSFEVFSNAYFNA